MTLLIGNSFIKGSAMKNDSCIAVSVVSHGHGQMVLNLVRQLLDCAEVGQIIVTCNDSEVLKLPASPRVVSIHNKHPKGFGANHNSAFAYTKLPWFVVLNPDVVLLDNPFPELLMVAHAQNVGIVSPSAVGFSDNLQDCWRQFPTVLNLLLKFLGASDGRYSLARESCSGLEVDWVSGLCMLFTREAYAKLNGFDEQYFMYYEDVDICVRTWRMGMRVLACPSASLVHEGQRASRRNLKHMRWHAAGLLRYLLTQSWRLKRPVKVNNG